VRRISAQISPNLPKTNCKENDLQKLKKNYCISLGVFFQNKALQAPFLPKFHPNLPKFPLTSLKKTTLKLDLHKKSALSFRVPFWLNQSAYSNFAQISTDFARF